MESLMAAGGKATVALVSDDLQHLEWIERACITPEDAYSVLAASRRLSRGRPYAILVDMTNIVALPPGARAVFNAESLVVAAALLGDGPMDEVLAAGACRAIHPTRYFTSEASALAWLRAFLVETDLPFADPRFR
ncbi:hypothetical protein [Arthrobacter agilis]|nr:hypothetical protein [Arthrobacter agilis]